MPVENNIERIQKVIRKALTEEFESQGHKMSGKAVSDLEFKTEVEGQRMVIAGFMYHYANILAAGTPASRIPYSGRTGKGGTSKYIQALINYAKSRMGADDKRAKSIAFAIAQTQKFSGDYWGMPTKGSYKFSKTGKRREWVGESLKRYEEELTAEVSKLGREMISMDIDVLIDKWNIELNK